MCVEYLIAAAGIMCTPRAPALRVQLFDSAVQRYMPNLAQVTLLASFQWMTMRWAGQMVNLIDMLYPKPRAHCGTQRPGSRRC